MRTRYATVEGESNGSVKHGVSLDRYRDKFESNCRLNDLNARVLLPPLSPGELRRDLKGKGV